MSKAKDPFDNDEYVRIPMKDALDQGGRRVLERVLTGINDYRERKDPEVVAHLDRLFADLLETVRSRGLVRDCVCCRRMFVSRGSDNVVCDPCRADAPEFEQSGRSV